MSIVKLGNFSQTARFLGYTQSTVTTHIQLLEKEFNTILFERFGHQLMLTTDASLKKTQDSIAMMNDKVTMIDNTVQGQERSIQEMATASQELASMAGELSNVSDSMLNGIK